MAELARDGGRLLLHQLVLNGIDTAFCVPGESFLPVLDAIYDAPVRLVVCRQEGGAAHMAAAYGRLTGRPGVCLVTRGPGATNASVGVQEAAQDSAPMLLLVGQVGRSDRGREAFQELEVARVFATMAKWTAEVDDAARIPEVLARAVTVSLEGRPGPVVLALPEDVLAEVTAAPDARPATAVQASPSQDQLAELRRLLEGSRRPLLLAGGPGWTAPAAADLRAFAEASRLPVAVSFRSQDLVDNRSPSYVGALGNSANPALLERVEAADLVVAIGTRLDELSTAGYRLPAPPRPRQRLVHVHQGAGELGKVYQPDLGVVAGMPAFAAAARALEPIADPRWAAWAEAARAAHLAWSTPAPPPTRAAAAASPSPAGLDLAAVVGWLRERLPADAIITLGAGNYTGWVQRYYQFRELGTQLGPKGGTMGYGVPAAIAAKLAHPDRTVVAFAGDGCFLMTGQELATAVQHGLAIVVIVVNNRMYGTIRMHQELAHPGRVVGTDLRNPDFAALARAFGAHGEVVTDTAGFPEAFERAVAAAGPALLELRTDPEAITTTATIAELRARAGDAAGAGRRE
ncbi:MAG TPA: thiamine pyrophosphate-binding protein [Actinomycetota bacterium]|nr:thiamine pyrophosphate-binding protein [Actinomycetota bacterium]